MRFDLDFYEKIIRPNNNRRLKYKFEIWLQDKNIEYQSVLHKKIIPIEDIEHVFCEIGMKVLGTHINSKDGLIEAGHNCYFCSCNKCGLIQRVGFQYAKKKSVTCYGCFVERLYDEAKEYGLELIDYPMGGDKKRRHYRFPCGHTRDISSGDVRVGAFSCTECRKDNLEQSLHKHDLKLIGRPDKTMCSDPTQFYHVKYNFCGHERIVSQQNLMFGSVGRCEKCYEKELQEKYGEKWNIDILSKVVGARREIVFRKCGHTKIISLSNLKSGNFDCYECKLERWKQEAEESSLIYIGEDKNTRGSNKKKHLYKASCGHILSLKQSAVREGHWTCRTCNSGYLDRFNYLYVFKITATDGFQFLKFGYSMKPEHRKYDYIVDKGTDFELIRKVFVPTGRLVITLENLIHDKLSEFNLDKTLMKKYLTESGFTECYPVSTLNILLQELDLVEKLFNEKEVVVG